MGRRKHLKVRGLLEAAIGPGVAKYPSLQSRWISAGFRLPGGERVSGLGQFQPDYLFDLVIRCLEDELAEQLASSMPPEHDLTIQVALSRYWVLSTYEALRMANAAGDRSLSQLHEKFRLVRIALAKLEIARGGDQSDLHLYREGESSSQKYEPGSVGYVVPTEFERDTGSVCWVVADAKNARHLPVYRRALSDELLDILAPAEA
jgi:hypothetical protein